MRRTLEVSSKVVSTVSLLVLHFDYATGAEQQQQKSTTTKKRSRTNKVVKRSEEKLTTK